MRTSGDATIEEPARAIERSRRLARDGDYARAVALLTTANRARRDPDIERELVDLRRAGGQRALTEAGAATGARRPAPIAANGPGGTVVEIAAAELTVDVLRDAFAACGCLLVRGLVPETRAGELAAGIDAALAGYDASLDDRTVDPVWYEPRPMPDRSESGLPEPVHRAFLRSRGSLWTADSPRMLFELLECLDAAGLTPIMEELLGERPLLSGLKATLRRMPPDVDVDGRWHQDGSFLGQEVLALNIWLALNPCGRDAPGLDIVARRLDGVITDEHGRYEWAVSDDAVRDAAGATNIVRPTFEAGDALLFDQLLLHRTGASPDMTKVRYAIESWFFPPSAYPEGQLPILY